MFSSNANGVGAASHIWPCEFVSNSVLLERRTDPRYDHRSPVEDSHIRKLPKPE